MAFVYLYHKLSLFFISICGQVVGIICAMLECAFTSPTLFMASLGKGGVMRVRKV